MGNETEFWVLGGVETERREKMSFMRDFDVPPRRPSSLSYFLLVLLGAILGSLFSLTAVYYYGLPAREAAPLIEPDSSSEAKQEGESELLFDQEVLLPEHQNTAVVRAAQQVTPAVVGISNRQEVFDFFRGTSRVQEAGTGSGVIIDAAGLIVTNYHVIREADEVIVSFPDGEDLRAEIVGADPITDLAVLRVTRKDLAAASFGDSDVLRVGEMVIAIGNPLGLAFQQTVTLGVISATERFIEAAEHRFPFIQTDAAINPGNSGGALVDLKGRVIGINTAKIKLPGFEGMGFAIPSNMAKKIVAELIEHGRIIRPWMGIVIDEISPSKAEALGLPVDYGILVVKVVAGSPADRAGLKLNDLIVGVAGEKIVNFDALRHILFEHRAGDKIDVKIIRDGQELILQIVLGELPRELGG